MVGDGVENCGSRSHLDKTDTLQRRKRALSVRKTSCSFFFYQLSFSFEEDTREVIRAWERKTCIMFQNKSSHLTGAAIKDRPEVCTAPVYGKLPEVKQ